MNEFKTEAFAGFEKQIGDARLMRSAMIGDAIGNGIAAAWFGAQRLATKLNGAIAAMRAARTRQVAGQGNHIGRHQVASPH